MFACIKNSDKLILGFETGMRGFRYVGRHVGLGDLDRGLM
jgi:hypothetical protein